jgi:hypothetical protein
VFALRPLRRALVLWLAAATLTSPRAARADAPFEGKWVQGPLKEEYSVIKWQKECEAPPVNGSSGGGESVNVSAEGDELSFVGGGRVFKTNRCYDQMPTLVRESHTRNPSGKEWRTRCTTPPNDPRHAVVNTLVVATTDTHIDMVETGRYESQLAGGLCSADVKRSRSFDLVAPATPPPSPVVTAPTPTPPPAAPPPQPTPPPATDPGACSSPGDPTRLEARPSRKLLKPGDTFAFRALVLDASGCTTRTPTTWSVDDKATSSKALSVDPGGKVTVASDAVEGSYGVVVSAAGKSTRVTVEIAGSGRYDALLQQSGLNDAGEADTASVVMIASAQIGGGNARGEGDAHRRRSIFLAIVGALAVGLGAMSIVAVRRGRKAAALEREAQERYAEKVEAATARRREKAARHAAAMKAHEESVEQVLKAASEVPPPPPPTLPMVCPACRREYPQGSAFCPQDASRLVPLNAGRSTVPPQGGMICPACKRGYEPGLKTCPHDREELIPYALYASRTPASINPVAATRGKICPSCGSRFEGGVDFCGKDGTALVLIN